MSTMRQRDKLPADSEPTTTTEEVKDVGGTIHNDDVDGCEVDVSKPQQSEDMGNLDGDRLNIALLLLLYVLQGLSTNIGILLHWFLSYDSSSFVIGICAAFSVIPVKVNFLVFPLHFHQFLVIFHMTEMDEK